MELKGKKAIIFGERDGVPGPAIAEVIQSAGAEPVLVQTLCSVWTAAGALDLDGQESMLGIAESVGKNGVLVVLGSPTPESTEIYAETAVNGDPSYAGPLAGVALKLPVYHVLEDEIKKQSDPAVYEQQVALMEDVLERDLIIEAVRKVRASAT